MSDYAIRFSGIRRLLGVEGLERLQRAHVCVVGIGGVGSWAVEALARSGVGELTLVDLDEICVSNVNRQVHALDGGIGMAKVEAMAQRARAINPECQLHPLTAFFTEANAESILAARFDYVLDAMDSIAMKCLLIALCRKKSIPVITVGAAGGRRDPGVVKITDLALSTHDRLLHQIRKELRRDHAFTREPDQLFQVDCVHSPEPVVYPQTDGSVCDRRDPDSALRLNCDNGYGTACFVTGTFGFVAAGHVIQKIAGGEVARTPA